MITRREAVWCIHFSFCSDSGWSHGKESPLSFDIGLPSNCFESVASEIELEDAWDRDSTASDETFRMCARNGVGRKACAIRDMSSRHDILMPKDALIFSASPDLLRMTMIPRIVIVPFIPTPHLYIVSLTNTSLSACGRLFGSSKC